MPSAWPRDGMFDVSVCEDMERRIRDHKIKDKSKKRQDKRDLELNILNMFKTEGEKYRKLLKEGFS